MSSNATCLAILELKSNFLLYLYLPTFARSYLNSSKNLVMIWFLEESSVAGSPGLNFS